MYNSSHKSPGSKRSHKKDIFLEGLKSGFFNLDNFLTISEGTEKLSLEDFTDAGQQELVARYFPKDRFIVI